jgi:lipopolysaccharide export system protein LptA
MISCIDIMKIKASVLFIFLAVISRPTLALPDDAEQGIVIEGGASELDFAQGLYVIRENAEGLAHIKQGSLEIFGSEIRVEIVDRRVIKKATATGTPARFQQQPDIDEPIVYISGLTLDYDNNTRMLNIDGEASYRQGKTTLDGLHIDYHLDTRDAHATADESGTVILVFPPASVEEP